MSMNSFIVKLGTRGLIQMIKENELNKLIIIPEMYFALIGCHIFQPLIKAPRVMAI